MEIQRNFSLSLAYGSKQEKRNCNTSYETPTQSKLTTKNYLLHVCLANAQDIGFNNVTLIPFKKSELYLICTNGNITQKNPFFFNSRLLFKIS